MNVGKKGPSGWDILPKNLYSSLKSLYGKC